MNTPSSKPEPSTLPTAAVQSERIAPQAAPPTDRPDANLTAELLAAQGAAPESPPASTPRLLRPFAQLETLMEGLVSLLKRWALIELIQIFATLWIAVGAFQYVMGRKEAERARRRSSHYAAWQVVNSAQGKGGSGGRVDALEDLARDSVSLAGVHLDDAWLYKIQLPGADLQQAKFINANLVMANLRRAILSSADLRQALLSGADLDSAFLDGAKLDSAQLHSVHFQGAQLHSAKLRHANLVAADLQGAQLQNADLQGADLTVAKLQGANLYVANLDSVNLEEAHLDGVDLGYANLHAAILGKPHFTGSGDTAYVAGWRAIRNLDHANITGVQYPPPGFLRWAIDTMGAIAK